jgi:all-trans-8'-apo-beta-carotenal 15,15'-oxygenase
MATLTAPRPLTAPAATTAAAGADPMLAGLWSRDLPRQHGFEPLAVEGTIPRELRGTLYRNGPGQFGVAGTRYTHPFEGDGAITALRLDGGTARGAALVTQSEGLVEEQTAGAIRYGQAAPWWRRFTNVLRSRYKNTANTSVVMWQGRLFALMEGAPPTELDPTDLSMIGETHLGGVVGQMFSAHPHRVESRRAIYNVGLAYGRVTKLNLYELPDVGTARCLGSVELGGPVMLHDFIATDTHLVFFVSPAMIVLPRMFLQVGTFEDMWTWRPERGTEVICVPIDRPTEVVRFTVDAFYQWHFGNAFDRGAELVIDYVRYPNFDSFYEFGRYGAAPDTAASASLAEGRPHRAVIDLRARTLRSEPVLDRAAEFPSVAPGRGGSPDALVYAAFDNLGAIGRFDPRTGATVTHELPATQRATEPLFVPRPGATADDDGHVIALCHDAPSDRAFFAIYDAARLPDGPIAKAWFDHQVPITFHGTWAPAPAPGV